MHEILPHRAKDFPAGVNPVDKALYLQLKCRIYRQQSGGTLDSIAGLGVSVSGQIGAPLMALKQVASKYQRNSVVARLLWDDSRREEQIVATLLFADDMGVDDVLRLLPLACSIEVCEYAGSQWLAALSSVDRLFEAAFDSSDEKVLATMIAAAARREMMAGRGACAPSPMAKKYILRRYECGVLEALAERYRFKYEL